MNWLKLVSVSVWVAGLAWPADKPSRSQISTLDEYIEQVAGRQFEIERAPGSIYTPAGRLADLARDIRGVEVGDLITIVVSDRASAVARGSTSSSRKASAGASVGALFGSRSSAPWSQLANLGSSSELEGEGETTRQTTLSTTISAWVTQVLPNGNLVVEGGKEIWINSERQQITVRGVVRPHDLGPFNTVRSDRLAFLEIRVNGKGVVSDAVRRPGFLYRLLLGLLPF